MLNFQNKFFFSLNTSLSSDKQNRPGHKQPMAGILHLNHFATGLRSLPVAEKIKSSLSLNQQAHFALPYTPFPSQEALVQDLNENLFSHATCLLFQMNEKNSITKK